MTAVDINPQAPSSASSQSLQAAILLDFLDGPTQAARRVCGIPAGAALPEDGTPERLAYDTASRRFQRWITHAEEGRTASEECFYELLDTLTDAEFSDYLDATAVA